MKSIYLYLDYKEFVKDWAKFQTNAGRGVFQQISVKTRMHRASVSQVFSGEKHLNLEQASELIEFLGLKDEEGVYFLLLINYAKAGSSHLKNRLERMLLEEQRKALEAPHSHNAEKVDETLHSKFYSNWHNSAVSVLQSIPSYKDSAVIAAHLRLPRKVVNESVSFLKKVGLQSQVTYLSPTSPFINIHRTQWRLQAVQRFPNLQHDEIAFSAPISLSEKDFIEMKNQIRSFIEKLYQTVEKTSPETGVIFNIDWIRL